MTKKVRKLISPLLIHVIAFLSTEVANPMISFPTAAEEEHDGR